jgi:hypothetical protein
VRGLPTNVRTTATLLLSEIIARLPELKLDEGSLHFLSAFYADRLQDFPSISEVLKGILALLTNHTITGEDVVAIIRRHNLHHPTLRECLICLRLFCASHFSCPLQHHRRGGGPGLHGVSVAGCANESASDLFDRLGQVQGW